MDTSKINLNLLRALNALLTEVQVSRAGRKLGITQAAMSSTLKQLRDIFQDQLLVPKQGGQMWLTPLAESLIIPVRQALDDAQAIFSKAQPFDPKTATDIFHIGMSDYISLVLLPKLIQAMQEQAPHVKLVIHHMNYLENVDPFEKNKVDLVLGSFDNLPSGLFHQALFNDHPVCVAAGNHPAFKKSRFTLQDFLTYPHIMVSFVSDPTDNFINQLMKKLELPSPVVVTVPHAYIALYALPGTEFITSTVERIASSLLKPLKLTMRKMPFTFPADISTTYTAYQYWHLRDQNNPSHSWLRKMVKTVSENISKTRK